MNIRKIAREWKRAGLALVVVVAAICATGGCNPINAIGELNYLGKWLGSTLGSGSTTGF